MYLFYSLAYLTHISGDVGIYGIERGVSYSGVSFMENLLNSVEGLYNKNFFQAIVIADESYKAFFLLFKF